MNAQPRLRKSSPPKKSDQQILFFSVGVIGSSKPKVTSCTLNHFMGKKPKSEKKLWGEGGGLELIFRKLILRAHGVVC